MLKSWLLFGAALSIPAFGSQTTPGSQSTTGNCSPILTGDHITVTCTDKKALADIQAMLKKMQEELIPASLVLEKLEEIRQGVLSLKPRRLSAEQKKALADVAMAHSGQYVEILCDSRVPDACGYAQDFVDALAKGNWQRHYAMYLGITQMASEYSQMAEKNYILLNKADFDSRKIPPAALDLARAASTLEIKFTFSFENDFHTPAPGEFWIVIGDREEPNP